jgi:hypothetical protein
MRLLCALGALLISAGVHAAPAARLQLLGWPLAAREPEGWFAAALRAPGDSLALASALARAEVRLQGAGWLDGRLAQVGPPTTTCCCALSRACMLGPLSLNVPSADSAALTSRCAGRRRAADPTQLRSGRPLATAGPAPRVGAAAHLGARPERRRRAASGVLDRA